VNAVSIRRAELKDAPALASLFSDATMLQLTDVAPYSAASHWEQRLADYADLSHLPLIATAGDVIVGVILLQGFPNHIRRKHSASIRLLAVRAAHRRRGVGRALVDAVIEGCDHWLNVRRIDVTIDAASAALTRYYASFGFVDEGVKRRETLVAGNYGDLRILSRINERILPAPVSAALVIAKRRKQPPVKITIRPATADDADAFAAVFATRGASNGTLQHPYTSSDIWHTRLSSNTTTRQVVFAAIVNGKVVGNAGVHPLSDNPRQRHVCGVGLAVIDAYQSRGVGRALMNACLDFADHWANYPRVELTVHADNVRAIKLYESLGFVIEGRHREFSFREGGYVDALFMGRLSAALCA
jgi:L-phenylalanine/L-methionine N-acetyltransferase